MYRIYLVEDDAIIARSIKKHLENWEYEVQCTKDFSADRQQMLCRNDWKQNGKRTLYESCTAQNECEPT